jgi:hypothetical protein
VTRERLHRFFYKNSSRRTRRGIRDDHLRLLDDRSVSSMKYDWKEIAIYLVFMLICGFSAWIMMYLERFIPYSSP